MTPEKFYAALRASGLFARGSSQSQVNGINALLTAVAGLAIPYGILGLKEKRYEQQKLDRYSYPRR
jgi:hypothetical protein